MDENTKVEFTIRVEVSRDGKVLATSACTSHSVFPILEQVMNAKHDAVRKGLMSLGWTPPKEDIERKRYI